MLAVRNFVSSVARGIAPRVRRWTLILGGGERFKEVIVPPMEPAVVPRPIRKKHSGPCSRNRRARRSRRELHELCMRMYADTPLGREISQTRSDVWALPPEHIPALRRFVSGGVNRRPDSFGQLFMMRERYWRGLRGELDARDMWFENLVAWVLLRRAGQRCNRWDVFADCIVRSRWGVSRAWSMLQNRFSAEPHDSAFDVYCESRLNARTSHEQALENARGHCGAEDWELNPFQSFVSFLIEGQSPDVALARSSRSEDTFRGRC